MYSFTFSHKYINVFSSCISVYLCFVYFHVCLYIYIYIYIYIPSVIFTYFLFVSFICFLVNVSNGCYFMVLFLFIYLLSLNTLLHFSHQYFSTYTFICIFLYLYNFIFSHSHNSIFLYFHTLLFIFLI